MTDRELVRLNRRLLFGFIDFPRYLSLIEAEVEDTQFDRVARASLSRIDAVGFSTLGVMVAGLAAMLAAPPPVGVVIAWGVEGICSAVFAGFVLFLLLNRRVIRKIERYERGSEGRR